MIPCSYVGRYPEERLLHQSSDARRDAFHGGAHGQTRDPRRRCGSFHETQSLHGFWMDAPIRPSGLGDLAIHQGSGSQAETQIFPFFQAYPNVASPRLSVRLLVGLVDGAACQKFDQKIVRYHASSQAHAQIPSQTGTGAESSRASRPGARLEGGTRVEKESSATDSSLLRSSQRDSSLRRREPLCLDSPYRKNLDFPQSQAHCSRLGSARRSCGSHFRGEPKGAFVFSVLQGQLQLQDVYPVPENAARSFYSPEDFFYRRWSAFPPVQSGERFCSSKQELVVASSIARLFSRTQLQRGGLECNQDPAAECQTSERPSRAQEGCSWLSAIASKATSKGARVL